MPRRVALWLTLPTGFAGLVYEVTWERSLATLLGSHSEAAATVLALFLGGLAAGYALFGRLARRRIAPEPVLRLYGAVEIAIGLHALVFPTLLSVARGLSPRLPALADGPAFALDVGLSALLLAPAAIAMGATIPLLTQALPRSVEESTRIHARVYALNTLGAFTGALAAAFWILPALGLSGTLHALACVNLAAGGVYLALARSLRGQAAPAPPELGAQREPATAAAAAGLLGFAMMTAQTSMLRLSAMALGGSPFTFAMVVAVFVLCIALGSAAVSLLRRVPGWLLPATLAGLFLWLYGLYPFLEDAPYYAHRLRASFSSDASSFYPYHAAAFGQMLWVIGPAALLSGASLPLLFDRLRRDRGDLGGISGRLYAWNTLGSVGGALLGGYALFFWLDLHEIYRVAAAAVALALALLVGGRGWRAVSARAGVPALALAALVALPAWSLDRLTSGVYRIRFGVVQTWQGPDAFFAAQRRDRILFYDDDPSASISVKEFRAVDGQMDRNLVSNGKSDGAAHSEYTTMALTGLLPALFAERVERAFVVGFGTGVTVAELAALEAAQEVVVAEISRAVIEAAPLFDPLNGGASTAEPVQMVRGDAYRTLLRERQGFDVIVSQPSNPWVGGVEMLFSREFLEQGRRKLRPGGVYAQWLQLYETDERAIGLVLRNMADVFDHVSVWHGLATDLLLLGHLDGERALDVERLARRAARPDFAAGLARAGIEDLPALLAHEVLPLGTVQALGLEGPLHTLDHPRLRHAAALAFHAGALGELPRPLAPEALHAAEAGSLARRLQRARGPFSESERASFVRETCRYREDACLAVLAEWRHAVPASERRHEVRRKLQAEAWARKDRHRFSFQEVELLSRLFDPVPPVDAADGVASAEEATRLYARYLHPAAPFSLAGLRERWRLCEVRTGQPEVCDEARRALQSELGPLGLEP